MLLADQEALGRIHFVILIWLGFFQCSSGIIIIKVEQTTPDPAEMERCLPSLSVVPKLNLTRHFEMYDQLLTSSPMTLNTFRDPEVTIERPELIGYQQPSTEATPSRPRPLLLFSPLKVVTLPEVLQDSPQTLSSLTSLLDVTVNTPSEISWSSTTSFEPLTPTWYITSPPPTPLTVRTPIEHDTPVKPIADIPKIMSEQSDTRSFRSANRRPAKPKPRRHGLERVNKKLFISPKQPMITPEQNDTHSVMSVVRRPANQMPKQYGIDKETDHSFSHTPKLPMVTMTTTQPNTKEPEQPATHTQPSVQISAQPTTESASLSAMKPVRKGRREPMKSSTMQPFLREMEKELQEILRVYIPELMEPDIAKALNKTYRDRLQFANHEMVDKVLQQEPLEATMSPEGCPMSFYERRINLLRRMAGLLLLALPQSMEELEHAAWDEELENYFFRPGERNILDVPECRHCYVRDSIGRCRQMFMCKEGEPAPVRMGLTPEEIAFLLSLN